MPGGERLTWVSPLPPLPTGIGQYSAELLNAVAGLWDLDVLPEAGSGRLSGLRNLPSIRNVQPNSQMVLQIGNSQYHKHAFALAAHSGAILVMHDVVLHHARLAEFVRRGQSGAYISLMERLYCGAGVAHARDVLRGANVDVERFPLSEDLIGRARRVVVHSEHARQRIVELMPGAQVSVVPMGVPLPVLVDKQSARRHFGLREDMFLITSITHVNPMKRVPVVLRAFRRMLDHVPNARLIIAGTVSESVQLERQVELLGLQSHVRLMGYLSENDARILARAGDVSVNLRYPSTGETSASLLRLMAAAVPVVVTKHGSSMELPENSVLHLPVDRLEEETLAEYLAWLAADPDARKSIGAAGREFIERKHSMGAAIDGYRQAFRDTWGVELPGLTHPLVDERAPIVDVRPAAYRSSEETSPLVESVAASLHTLNLESHDGTIEFIAEAMSSLGLEAEDGVSHMSENQSPSIDPSLLEIIACPVCKEKVRLADDRLVCDTCGREYRIENGIPVMLIEDDAEK